MPLHIFTLFRARDIFASAAPYTAIHKMAYYVEADVSATLMRDALGIVTLISRGAHVIDYGGAAGRPFRARPAR